jgi:Zn2+/Cd2+-exporting ATPase
VLYWRDVVPRAVLLAGIALGLYPLARIGLVDLWRDHKIGTEVFVTAAALIALAGGEYVAASVLMTIILVAEFIADFNTDRARASIKALIGVTPQTAVVRSPSGDHTVPVDQLKPGSVVLVRAGDRVPVDGTVIAGAAAVNEAVITGESVPVERVPDTAVLAGTVVETGAIDVRTEKVAGDTLFARIVALVEEAESEQAPVQKLADDDLGKIVAARILARRAYRTIQENLVFGVGVVHVLGIIAALAGWIGPIQAALLHLGPDVLVFLNSIKLLRIPIASAAMSEQAA